MAGTSGQMPSTEMNILTYAFGSKGRPVRLMRDIQMHPLEQVGSAAPPTAFGPLAAMTNSIMSLGVQRANWKNDLLGVKCENLLMQTELPKW